MTTTQILGGALILTALILLKFAVSNKLKLRFYSRKSDKLSAPIRIAQISDLHESVYGERQSELIRALRGTKPDLIVFTGDIIEDIHTEPINGRLITDDNPALALLLAAAELAPTYMVLGNHESNIPCTDVLYSELSALGLNVLHRYSANVQMLCTTATVNGQEIVICGADDPYFLRTERGKKNNLRERFIEDADRDGAQITDWRRQLLDEFQAIKSERRLTILLSHRPEEFELYEKLGFDVAFSGHAHGGQWRFPPFINGVYSPHQGIFPKHAGGIYKYDKFTHVVSRGLSKKRMVRIFNRPELVIFDALP